MDILRQSDLEQLIEESAKWCVSLYMPTHRFGREQKQDPIRFKNLIVQAREKLKSAGLNTPEFQELLRPAERLLQDDGFWMHQSDGLAFFLSPDLVKTYRLPENFAELLVVQDRFHTTPLLPVICRNAQFYILALSMNEIRLFLGTRNTIDEIELQDIPTNLQEALGMDDDVEKYLGNRTTFRSHGRVRMQRSLFHGHGGEAPSQKKNILRYFHRVDEGLNKLLEDQSIPMMLAGVEYLLPIFQEASSYDRILDEGLLGNPEEVETKELHALAWEIVEPLFKEQQEQSTEKFLKFFGQGSELASTDLATIVKAAVQGRVETLFVPLDVQRWGRYDRQKNEVILEAESGVDNEDLLDFAAMRTVMHSGTVYALPMADLPGGAEQAAILRYAV